MAINTVAGAVSRWQLARQIVRVRDCPRIGTAAIGKAGELQNQGAFSRAGGVGEGRCFTNMVDMALDATPCVGAVVVAMLLAGTGECRVTAVSRSCSVARATAAGRGQDGRRPQGCDLFKMAIDVVAAPQLRIRGLRPSRCTVIIGCCEQ